MGIFDKGAEIRGGGVVGKCVHGCVVHACLHAQYT